MTHGVCFDVDALPQGGVNQWARKFGRFASARESKRMSLAVAVAKVKAGAEPIPERPRRVEQEGEVVSVRDDQNAVWMDRPTIDGNPVLSSCCFVPVRVMGTVTHWYQCNACGQPCDAVDVQERP